MATLRVVPYTGDGDPTPLIPAGYQHSAPHYDALDRGELTLQRCDGCELVRYPVAPSCPSCGDDGYRWTAVRPTGRLHSWIRYHKVYLQEFAPLVPYCVGVIQLDAGPRVAGRWLHVLSEPAIGMQVELVAERFPSGRSVLALAARDVPPMDLGS